MNQQAFSEALDKLTPRQHEVLTRVLAGEPDSEVAESLDIELATVRKHVQRIYQVFESFISSEPNDRRSRRGDLFALFAQYKPELLGTVTEATPEKLHDSSDLLNPFVPLTGMVEKPQQFFNCQKELSTIFEILNSGSSVAIIGDREIGKSSLLWAIYLQAERQLRIPRQPIYLNLQEVCDEQDFYEALCSEVGIEVCKGYRLKRELSQKQPRLLLLLDEVEKMTWEGFTNQLRGQLRGLAEGSNAPLRLVVASSASLDTLFPDSQKIGMTSPLKGICIEERIHAWDEVTVREFIRHCLAETSICFKEEEIFHLVQESGGRPKKLMQLCYETYERYREKMQ